MNVTVKPSPISDFFTGLLVLGRQWIWNYFPLKAGIISWALGYLVLWSIVSVSLPLNLTSDWKLDTLIVSGQLLRVAWLFGQALCAVGGLIMATMWLFGTKEDRGKLKNSTRTEWILTVQPGSLVGMTVCMAIFGPLRLLALAIKGGTKKLRPWLDQDPFKDLGATEDPGVSETHIPDATLKFYDRASIATPMERR